jgi:hypothetical protein
MIWIVVLESRIKMSGEARDQDLELIARDGLTGHDVAYNPRGVLVAHPKRQTGRVAILRLEESV